MPNTNTRFSQFPPKSNLYANPAQANSVALLALGLIGGSDDRRGLGNVLAEDVSLDEVWKPDG
jgi:hypothetical protein